MAEPDEINERYLARAIKAMNALGDELAHTGGGGDRAAVAGLTLRGLDGRGSGEGDPLVVVDHLHRQVLVGTEHGQAGPGGGSVDLLADTTVTTDPAIAAGCCDFAHDYFFPALPALRMMRSPA